MFKINILAALFMLIVFTVGCISDGGNQPPSEVPSNVYLPQGPAGGCDEIEVEWHTFLGSRERAFFSGREDQCLNLLGLNRQPDPPPIRVRCVSRSSDGSLTVGGPWINGIKASSKEEFLNICPTKTGAN